MAALGRGAADALSLRAVLGGAREAGLAAAVASGRVVFSGFSGADVDGLELEAGLRGAVMALSDFEAREVIAFVCGTDVLPERGLRFVYQPALARGSLMVAHTCFRSVDVSPQDAGAERAALGLRERLLFSARESGGRFLVA